MNVTNNSLYMQASDGREITLTKADIQAIYQATSGNAATRKAATITECKNRIITALGSEQIDLSNITLDMSIAEMRVSLLYVEGPF